MRKFLMLVGIFFTIHTHGQISFIKRDESCEGRKDGSIEVLVAGSDNSNLTYTWKKDNNPYPGERIITGLEPANYAVTVTTKAGNCMAFNAVKIYPGKNVTLELSARLLDVSPDPLGCGERPVFTYKLYAFPRGGTPPYTCSWGAGGLGDLAPGQTNDECTLVVSGSFINQSVSVIDSNGCVDSEGFKKTGAIRICPRDPNDITGPDGHDSMRWVSVKDEMPYAIRFENDPIFATSNAAVVFVTVAIDDDINPFSFRLGSMGFGSKIIEVPENISFFQQRLDYSDDLGFMLDVTAGLDVPNNRVFWLMETIDPATGQPPSDPTAGFLPVNDTLTGSGEGFINFFCSPKSSTLTGETVEHQAAIVFDLNDPLLTNTWTNTIDAYAPETNIEIIPDTLYTNIVPFDFVVEDDPGGCGVQFAEIFLSTDNGIFQSNGLLNGTDSTALMLNWGTTYYYKVTGTDFVENRESNVSDSFYIIPQRAIEFVSPDQDVYCIGDTLQIETALTSIPFVDLYISVDSGMTYTLLDSGVDTWPYPMVLDSELLQPYLFIKARSEVDNIETTSIPFTVHTLPVLSTPGPINGCDNEILFAETSGANSFLWGPDSIIGNTTSRFTNVYAEMSQYAWVQGTDVFGCSTTDSVWINLYPTTLDTFSQPLCEGDSISIDGDWVSEEGYYPVTHTSAYGCDSIIVAEVFFESPCIWAGGQNVYVDKDATGDNTGTSWADAFNELRDAVYVAGRYENVQEIWVAEGVYHPHPTNRDTSFILKDSIKIYGGFLGFETELSERTADPELVQLSGDINIPDTLWDNSYHTVIFSQTCTQCIVDAVTITYGHADHANNPDNIGAGVLNNGVGHFRNVIFERNYATDQGGALHSSGTGANLIIEDCIFRLNTSSLGKDVVNLSGAQIEFRGANGIH